MLLGSKLAKTRVLGCEYKPTVCKTGEKSKKYHNIFVSKSGSFHFVLHATNQRSCLHTNVSCVVKFPAIGTKISQHFLLKSRKNHRHNLLPTIVWDDTSNLSLDIRLRQQVLSSTFFDVSITWCTLLPKI